VQALERLELDMNSIARLTDGVAQGVSLLKSTIEALYLTVILVALACLIGLMLAGTFGILHNGDDFDLDFSPGAGSGGGDLIVVPSLLT
jgi:hypothetical protein